MGATTRVFNVSKKAMCRDFMIEVTGNLEPKVMHSHACSSSFRPVYKIRLVK
jgi:hypothetical protein